MENNNDSNSHARRGPKTGSLNQDTRRKARAISVLAREHSDVAIKTLVEICQSGESEAARVNAADKLLDRAYGKAPQALVGDDSNPIRHVFGWMPVQS